MKQSWTSYGRFNVVLGVLLLVQIVLVAILYWPQPAAGGEAHPLLGDLTADAVTELTISDNTGTTVSLERDGDNWTLAGTDGYPAKAADITSLLDKLLAIKSDRLVATKTTSQDRLQVADDNYARKLDLTTDGGVYTLYFGSASGPAATHVRLAGDDNTYLTGAVDTWELDPAATKWIDVAYFNAATDDIEQVKLENSQGTLTFLRGEDGEWTLDDKAADEVIVTNNISTLISRISSIRLQTVLGQTERPDYGLADPQATIEVTAKDSDGNPVTTTFLVGAKDEADNAYYFKSSASPYYVLLGAYTGDEFANKQRSDYVTQPEEASTTPDAASAAPEASVDSASTPIVSGTATPSP
jgi:hypothetical protein